MNVVVFAIDRKSLFIAITTMVKDCGD